MLEQVNMERAPVKEDMTWEEALKPNKVTVTSISLKSWLNMWARLFRGSAGMDDFPIWVQLLPRVLFNVIVARSVELATHLRRSFTSFVDSSSGELSLDNG